MVLMLSLTPYANYRQTAFGNKQSFTLILLYVHTRGTYLFIYTTYIRTYQICMKNYLVNNFTAPGSNSKLLLVHTYVRMNVYISIGRV